MVPLPCCSAATFAARLWTFCDYAALHGLTFLVDRETRYCPPTVTLPVLTLNIGAS